MLKTKAVVMGCSGFGSGAWVRDGALRSTGFTRLANIFRGGSNVADDAGSGESGGGILRRIGDLKQLCAGRDRVAGNVSVIEKNGRAENDNGVVSGELIGERFLRGQQAAAKKAMGARKRPARSDRLGVDVGIQSLGEGDHVAPSAIFFDLRASDQREIAAGINCANHFIERERIGGDRLAHFARGNRLAGLVPIVHRDRDENGSARRLHGEVITACDCRGNILGAKRFVGPFDIRLHDFDGATHEKRLS